ASLKEMTMTQVIEQYIDRISLDKAQAD
ncbi:CopG family transcriptional regulator, partial [Cyanobacterium aponinum IPPAS B-1201]